MAKLLAATLTPFRHEAVDLQALQSFYKYLLQSGVDALWVIGTTGLTNMLRPDEKIAVVKAAVEAVGGEKILAGANADAADEAVRLAKTYADAGAWAVFSLPPIYHKPNTESLYRFFETVAKASPRFYAYNFPAATGYEIPWQVLEKLAREGLLTGIKYTTGDLASFKTLRRRLKTINPNIEVLIGTDKIAAEAVAAGADGVITAMANAAPRLLRKIIDLAATGALKEALKLETQIEELADLARSDNPPANLYTITKCTGHDVGTPREPLQPTITEDICRTLKHINTHPDT